LVNSAQLRSPITKARGGSQTRIRISAGNRCGSASTEGIVKSDLAPAWRRPWSGNRRGHQTASPHCAGRLL